MAMTVTTRGVVATHASWRHRNNHPNNPTSLAPSATRGRLPRLRRRPFAKRPFSEDAVLGRANPEVGQEGDAVALALAAELEALVGETRASGAGASLHVVAFSGGVDSSLAAYLVQRAFGDGDGDGDVPGDVQSVPGGKTSGVAARASGDDDDEHDDAGLAGAAMGVTPGTGARGCVAAIGVSPALPAWQLAEAREVAAAIGIALWEVPTEEGLVPEYVANEVSDRRAPRGSAAAL